jgi:hypothetical protein
VSTWPDVEGALRTHLRADAGVAALVGQRVFFGVPRGAKEETYPLVVVQRVGGGQDASEAPVDVALVQVDCWGSINNGNGLKAECTALVNSVRAALESVGTDSTAVLKGADVESVLWLPQVDNDRPRYAVTAVVTAISP